MDFWTFVFLVVLCGCAVAMFETWSKSRAGIREAKSKGGVNRDQDRRIAALAERVGVLEEIVTDKRYELTREIEELEHRSSSSR